MLDSLSRRRLRKPKIITLLSLVLMIFMTCNSLHPLKIKLSFCIL